MKINPKSQIVTKLLDTMYGVPQCDGKHKLSKRTAAAHALEAIGVCKILDSVEMLRFALERGAPLPPCPTPGYLSLGNTFDQALAAVLSLPEIRGDEGNGDNSKSG